MRPHDKTLMWCIFWLLCFAMSYLHGAIFAPTAGDPLTQGLDRAGAFIGWQFGALVFAIVAAVVSRSVDRAEFPVIRWLGLGPIIVMVLEILIAIGAYLYINFVVDPEPSPVMEPKPVTAPN